MRKCPQCGADLRLGSPCAACGYERSQAPDSTLDVGAQFDDTQEEAEEPQPASGEEPPETVDPIPAGGRTLDPDELEETEQEPVWSPKSSRRNVQPLAKNLQSPPPPQPPSADAPDAAEPASGQPGSGTAGRLKRIWKGAAGSNPLNTLKGEDALATDSVFERIAPRALVTDGTIDFTEAAASVSGSQPKSAEMVKECLSAACQDAAGQEADYRVTGLLGQGGMGVVLKAYQQSIGRDVAIKMIQPSRGRSSSSSQAQHKKFLYEAQITGMLDHPNIVPIYELGISNGVLFYSMKKIEGIEWKECILTNSRDENLEIWMKVADAVAFAHGKQVIHRDLKPENVMLGRFGEVLVTDWGCAVDLTRKEKIAGAGSPPWMAPEMADQDHAKIGPLSDVYLMGAILYQLTVGHPPHPGQTVLECIHAAQKNVIINIEGEDPLLDIAYKAMATEPQDRYASMEDMQNAVRVYQTHAESITLVDRSVVILNRAIESSDYESFSRAMFGLQDAISLWRGNSKAHAELKRARLAYGQCAFDRGDFDLCLATLDGNIAQEKALIEKAQVARQAAHDRDARLKKLKKTFAAAIGVAVVGLAILSAYALLKRREAIAKATEAEFNFQQAETQRKLADEKTIEARKNFELADEQREAAETNAAEAERQRDLAGKNLIIANQQRELADQRTAQVELGNYQSQLALCLGQIKQLDIASAVQSLKKLLSPDSYQSLIKLDRQPKFDNWASDRILLLSNQAILERQFSGRMKSVAFAESVGLGVVASQAKEQSEVTAFKLTDGKLEQLQRVIVESPVQCVAISPDGNEIVYSLEQGSQGPAMFRWLPSESQVPLAIENAQSRSLQKLSMSDRWLVGGINGGLWVWNRRQADWTTQEPERILSVRGSLQSLQLLPNDRALVLAELEGAKFVHWVDLSRASAAVVDFSNAAAGDGFAYEDLSAIALAGNVLVIGTNQGELYTTSFDPNAGEVGNRFNEIVPQNHESAIQSIRVHADQTLVTIASEPVVQVWKPSAARLSGWRHDTYLAGTTVNVADACYGEDSNQIVGFGEADGETIVWDAVRQKQLRQLQPVDAQNRLVALTSPVVQAVIATDGRGTTLVHADGSNSSWDIVSGRLSRSGEFTHVGHLPNTKFVDMAIDPLAGVMVTSALTRGARSLSMLEQSDESESENPVGQPRVWEYCKWDIKTGNMLDRWRRRSATEQEVSLADAGRLILYASDEQTVLAENDRSRRTHFVSQEMGSFFGVNHPIQTDWMMVVKRSGAVRVINAREPAQTWDRPGYSLDYDNPINAGLLSDDEVPLVGRWSPSGDRFYMVWSSGRITEFIWENERLQLGRDLRGPQLAEMGIALSPAGGGETRIASRWNLDLKVRESDEFDLLYVTVRFPGVEGRTRLARVAFPRVGKPFAAKDESELGPLFLTLNDQPQPSLSPELLLGLPVSSHRIVAAESAGADTYYATSEGTVYRASLEESLQTYGRPQLLSASGDQTARQIVTLHEGGVLWRGVSKDGAWGWSQLKPTLRSANRIAMSPDGSRLLIGFAGADDGVGFIEVDSLTGNERERVSGAQCFEWDPLRPATWAAVGDGGQVSVRSEDGNQRNLGKLAMDKIPRSLHFFQEPWNAAGKEPTRWLMTHCEASDGTQDELVYLPMQATNLNGSRQSVAIAEDTESVVCSPTDGIFVTGSMGTLSVYFAAPSLSQPGQQLFDLEGHAGAKIQCLAFSIDGKTLLSADDRGRLFAWLSNDHVGDQLAQDDNPAHINLTLP